MFYLLGIVKNLREGPILADLARLIHARSALQEGYEAVIWCDADTLDYRSYVAALRRLLTASLVTSGGSSEASRGS